MAKDYRREQKLKFDFIINTVIFPETIDDAWDVFEFCIENDFYWTPMPYIVGKYPNPGLIDNPRWQQLIDEVMRAKRKGARVYGNMEALRTIRDFKRFECYPDDAPDRLPARRHLLSLLAAEHGGRKSAGDWRLLQGDGAGRKETRPHSLLRRALSCWLLHRRLNRRHASGRRHCRSHSLSGAAPEKPLVLQRPDRLSGARCRRRLTNCARLPSLPPDTIRQLRREGMLENDLDFTSPHQGRRESHAAHSTHARAGVRDHLDLAVSYASEAKASDRQDGVSRAHDHPSEFSLFLRPEGPVLNSHVREGVAESLLSEERRRCGTVVSERVVPALRASNKHGCWLPTPSRTWLLNTGPSGLGSAPQNLTHSHQVLPDK